MTANPTPLVLLAAGASTRMGKPKQLLPINDVPLLRHVAQAALTGPISPVVVVLGANAEIIAPCLDGLAVRIVVNPNWAEGMGSSLRCGLEALLAVTGSDQTEVSLGLCSPLREQRDKALPNPNPSLCSRAGRQHTTDSSSRVQSVIIALADQPDLSAAHLARLIETQRATGRTIVATESDGVCGPPVLFTAQHFPALLALRGDAGARTLLRTHAAETATVPLSTLRDLDTPEDYARFTG